MMVLLGDAFDAKHLTNTVTGEPRSLEFRVQFHYNDHGQLKQISPWHDIPLYTPCGNVNMVVEIPKCAAPAPTAAAPLRPARRRAAPSAPRPPPHPPPRLPPCPPPPSPPAAYNAGGRAPSSRSPRARSSIRSSRTPRTASCATTSAAPRSLTRAIYLLLTTDLLLLTN